MTSDRYNGTVRLRRQHGMRGYGIYCRIIELIQSSPDGRIAYDVDDLVYDMREESNLIKEVVESYGLFDIVDGNLEDPYSKTPEAIAEAIEKQKHTNRSNAAKKAAATRRARREAEKKQRERETAPEFPTMSDAPLAVPERTDADLSQKQEPFNPTIEDGEIDELADRDPQSELFDKVRDAWNKAFERTYRVNRDLAPSAVCWQNFSESSKIYALQDFIDAFSAARRDKFAWQFKDALKPANMQRLLSQAEIERQAEANKRKQNEPELTFEQREMIEYANAKGWNWDNR